MEVILVVALGAAVAGFVQGLSGFAFGMVAMSFWAWVLEPQLAALDLPDGVTAELAGETTQVTEMLSRQRGVLQLVEWVVVDLDDRRDEVIEFD